MISIDDLKRRRNEWLQDGAAYLLLDSADCIHRVQRFYPDPKSSDHVWAAMWMFLDNPWGTPKLSHCGYATAEKAIEWIDVAFCDHFQWFEAA